MCSRVGPLFVADTRASVCGYIAEYVYLNVTTTQLRAGYIDVCRFALLLLPGDESVTSIRINLFADAELLVVTHSEVAPFLVLEILFLVLFLVQETFSLVLSLILFLVQEISLVQRIQLLVLGILL